MPASVSELSKVECYEDGTVVIDGRRIVGVTSAEMKATVNHRPIVALELYVAEVVFYQGSYVPASEIEIKRWVLVP